MDKIKQYLYRHTIDDERACIQYIERTITRLQQVNTDLKREKEHPHKYDYKNLKSTSTNFNILVDVQKFKQLKIQEIITQIKATQIPFKPKECSLQYNTSMLKIQDSCIIRTGNKRSPTIFRITKNNNDKTTATNITIKSINKTSFFNWSKNNNKGQPVKSVLIIRDNHSKFIYTHSSINKSITNYIVFNNIINNNIKEKQAYLRNWEPDNIYKKAESQYTQQREEKQQQLQEWTGGISLHTPAISQSYLVEKYTPKQIKEKVENYRRKHHLRDLEKLENYRNKLQGTMIRKFKRVPTTPIIYYRFKYKNWRIVKRLDKLKNTLKEILKKQKKQISQRQYATQALQHYTKISKLTDKMTELNNMRSEELKHIKQEKKQLIQQYKEKAEAKIQHKIDELYKAVDKFNQMKNNFYKKKDKIYENMNRRQNNMHALHDILVDERKKLTDQLYNTYNQYNQHYTYTVNGEIVASKELGKQTTDRINAEYNKVREASPRSINSNDFDYDGYSD